MPLALETMINPDLTVPCIGRSMWRPRTGWWTSQGSPWCSGRTFPSRMRLVSTRNTNWLAPSPPSYSATPRKTSPTCKYPNTHHHRVMRSRFSLLVTYMCHVMGVVSHHHRVMRWGQVTYIGHVMGVVSHHHSHEVRSRFSLLVTYMYHVMGSCQCLNKM